METLSGKIGSLSFDANGMIVSLKDANNHNYVKAPGLWRIIYQRGHEQEIELLASNLPHGKVNITDNIAVIYHESELVSVRIEAEIGSDGMIFNAELTCHDDILIREFQFPFFNLGDLPDYSLIRSTQGGALFRNLNQAFDFFHSNYMAQENKAEVINELYPGEASANCFCLFNAEHGLYLGSHDSSFQITMHHLRRSDDGIRATLVKYPFLRQGDSARYEGFALAPFNGDWHDAAVIYRRWADNWFKPPETAQWIKDFNGWQRLIMRHQYGQTFFRYSDLGNMLADGQAVDIDALFLFGWWNDGMDAGYPDYLADEQQGGMAALKSGIEEVHRQGGKVILYFNGQLIDHDTDFYRQTGRRIAIMNERGDEHIEVYNFSGEGTFLKQFGNRVFSTGCFSCREWVEVLKGCIDQAIELGVDSIFFDQFGIKLWPCFNASHGHAVPDMHGFAVKAKVVEELRDYIKQKSPGTSFATEMTSDLLASHVDFFHTINSGYGRGLRGGESFLEWFRFIFPEVQISDREIRDDKSDFKRRVNNALQMGLKSDVEIFRCRSTIAGAPKYAEYLAEANVLRRKIKDFIFSGRFMDDVPLDISNQDIRAKAYVNGERLLVLATHRHTETMTGTLIVPGWYFEKSEGLGGVVVKNQKNSQELELQADSLAVLYYRKD